MSVEPIGFLAAADPVSVAPAASVPANGFGAWFAQELSRVNTELQGADRAGMALAAGQPVALHEVMLQIEQAHMSFQLLAQVRNRLLEAYQEVTRTQL